MSSNEIRIDELDKIWAGLNTAADFRGKNSGKLSLDDLAYYLYNRKRVLQGKKAHTAKEWLEAVR